MEFPYSSTLSHARENIILAAAFELNHLYQVCPASLQFSDALGLFKSVDGHLVLLNGLAYKAIDRLTPSHHHESLQCDLEENPIDLPELAAVLNRPISDCLQVFQRKQA
ncbi:hypothetical protein [Pseudomonas viridiflava]|uniref:hypothetical protein n=1 Tax=Pseudomonas viridiflava TaxID=33069 RepID=UPI000F03D330|nr:hypothetical protein [Pseudomonas viridiflava]